ncbi:MAG: MBL fold metallo-hydrolase [Acetatifactor sp.]
MKVKITDCIHYIKATDIPLSSDVGIVDGKEYCWIFDVGNNEEARQTLGGITKNKAVVLSHFHPDHTGNLDKVSYSRLYCGDNTFKYTKTGEIVDTESFIEDGVSIHLFKIPSSHAKGSVGMEVNGEYAFWGDAAYCTTKNGKHVYNAQLLLEQIRLLESLSSKYILLSHEKEFVTEKDRLLEELRGWYGKRDAKSPYICIS